MSVENNSDCIIEAAYCPYLGDVRPPSDAERFKSFTPTYATSNEYNIWPTFDNAAGYWGVDFPTQIIYNGTPTNAFYLLRSEDKGLYFGVKTNSTELVTWSMELRPGWETAVDRVVPKTREIAGKPVHTPFAAIHMPFVQPGESRVLTPVVMEAYEGGWQEGADIYKEWLSTWLKPAEAPEWAGNPHSWLQLHINSPEDELRLRFTELPKVAEECKKNGVAAIQLVGWNHGGQDQGNPSHDPDPRLGTFDELKEAIRVCQDEIGVKVILFAKFTWADRGTDWFRNGLKELAVTDPYGDYFLSQGYSYQTITQLMGQNTKRLIPMCFMAEEYLKICEDEFKKIVELGAAGMLFDECQHHGGGFLCFNENHGHRYASPVYGNDRELIRRLRKTPGIADDFLMSGEACYEWEMDAYQLAYFRTEYRGHVPIHRYMLPHSQFMTAITGFNDRNMVNQCLMYRYVMSYEPYNFKGMLSDFPETVEYGGKMEALRTKYRKWFWDGEFVDKRGVSVKDEKDEPYGFYSVFKAADGSLGAVVLNYEREPLRVTVKSDGQKFGKYGYVDGGELVDFGGEVEIPARSAVILI